MHHTAQLDIFFARANAIHAQANAIRAQAAQVQAQLNVLNADINTINYQGQRAMEKITQDRAIPLAQRVLVFFDSPDGFTMHVKGRPRGHCKAMQSAINYAVEGRDRHATITLADMANDAYNAFKKDENAVVWWDSEKGYLAKDFLEEMLQRSLMTFDCY